MRRLPLRAIWAVVKKDLGVWLRQPANIAATILPPLAFLLIQALGVGAVGRSPVALVVQDNGQHGAQIARSIEQANVFRLSVVDATRALTLLRQLDVVAIITVPAAFSQEVDARQPAPIDVTVNNLNLDFTSDIRRAVPDAITQYYQVQGGGSPIQISVNEHDLRARDVQFFQYEVLPTIVLLLMISGLVSGGLATAREWDTRTVKELLLSPTARGALIAGKVLAGFVTTFGLGVLVLALTFALGWVQPQGVYWLSTLGVMALVALFAAGLGVAIGALVQRVQTVIGVAILGAIYLFFLSGGVGVLAFEPEWLQNIAAYIPLTYGVHALEMAVFYSSADQLGRDVAVLAASALVAIGLGVVAMRRGIAR
ncbi:MAG TPA: ABC transporter permease [Ktedonobacterales bacterium]|nr:ABC transporter permease [Ktedonobacterales bacterium]